MTITVSPASAIIKDIDGHDVDVDQYSKALNVITEPHRNIHAGLVFNVFHKFSSVANGANADLHLDVPAAVYPHLHKVRIIAGEGDIDIGLYEDLTVSADGTALTAFNLNRASATTADMDVYYTPTVSGVGTKVRGGWLPPTASGTGNSDAGAVDDSDFEAVLDASTKYLVRATNNSGSTIDMVIHLMWYEL